MWVEKTLRLGGDLVSDGAPMVPAGLGHKSGEPAVKNGRKRAVQTLDGRARSEPSVSQWKLPPISAPRNVRLLDRRPMATTKGWP
jgi:hypothetical protein